MDQFMLLYLRFREEYVNRRSDPLTGSVKAMLVTPAYVPDVFHETVEFIARYEVTGVGYAPGFGAGGRRRLEGRQWVRSVDYKKMLFVANNVEWDPINVGEVGYLILIEELNDSDFTSIPICCFGGGGLPQLTDGRNLISDWQDPGIFTF